MTRPRRVPGWPRTCPRCQQTIVFARTLAGPNGPGGKAMPLNEYEDPAGNVAVRQVAPGRAVCRVLCKDEGHDRDAELLAMPHMATCKPTEPPADGPPPGVVNLADFRRQKAAAGRRR